MTKTEPLTGNAKHCSRTTTKASGYDIIGDVHGHAAKLEELLGKLGYRFTNGVWQHSERVAVFVGDLIDRGPEQVRTCEIVRKMVEAGAAHAIMGNHEFNALAFHTPDGDGGYLRGHSDKNVHQHRRFLEETEGRPELRQKLLAWFMKLPLWLDLDGIRVVHACWHEKLMSELRPLLLDGNCLALDVLQAARSVPSASHRTDGTTRNAAVAFMAIETLLKGVEVDLPAGKFFHDKDGHERRSMRVKWWLDGCPTYAEAGLIPSPVRSLLPEDPLPLGAIPGYSGGKPVFVGHYWLTGPPAPLAGQVGCVDYSAGNEGPLVAYRWSGEAQLDRANFVATGCKAEPWDRNLHGSRRRS